MVLDSVRDAMVVVDEHCDVLWSNQLGRHLLGVADLAGATLDHGGVWGSDGTTPLPQERLPWVLAAGGHHDRRTLVVHKDGDTARTRLYVEASPAIDADGRRAAVVVCREVLGPQPTHRCSDHLAPADMSRLDLAEDETRASEELMRLLLEGAPDYAIFMIDPDHRIATWSASAQRLTGYSEDDVLGEGYSILFDRPAVEAGEPDRIVAAAVTDRQEIGCEWRRKDETWFWATGTVTPMLHPDGSLRGFVNVTHDGTERRRAEEKFRGLLESAPEAMIGMGPDGRIVFANTQTERLFGYSRDDLIGQPVEILLPPRLREAHLRHRAHFVEEPTTRPMGVGLRLVARRKDGSEFPVDVSLSTLQADEGLIVSATIRDISDRQRIQQAIEDLNAALRRTNDELELRVARRTATLAAQTAELRAANAELDAFSYSVSHDLRAPLRAMDGFAKILAVKYGDVLDSEGRRYLDKVRDGAQHMGQLIDGLLTFSRLQRQSLTRRTIDMRALFHDIWRELSSERIHRDIRLTVGDLPPAYADPLLLRHVLSNLLGNALKYTRIRDPSCVMVSAAVNAAGEVVYAVRDNGVGFDMRYADKLFKVFQRMHRAEEYEGTGIGLALAARIIQRHGGRIWADGEVGKGATFYFVLPDGHGEESQARIDQQDSAP